jgi:hypothetical protein
MTKEILKAQDEILRQAWREGALKDEWFNKWIQEIYAQQAKNLQQTDVSSNGTLPKKKIKKKRGVAVCECERPIYVIGVRPKKCQRCGGEVK